MFISKKDGINFSKLSGDFNKIHTNDLYGYNSMYGDIIIHGCNLIKKFFENQKIKKFKKIKFNFNDGFYYNKNIQIKKKKNKIYQLIQDKNLKAEIKIDQKKDLVQKIEHKKNSKNFIINKKIIKKFKNSHIETSLLISLCYLSRYVGMFYPGKNSLIIEINISILNKNIKEKSLRISSYRLDRRFPIIQNILTYKNIKIDFKTAFRPQLENKHTKINSKILKKINNINKNILIIGASSGIGADILRLFKTKNNNKIIATYFKNKITTNKKNLIIKKINVLTELNKIKLLIKQYSPLILYYFATPKININYNSKFQSRIYKKYFIDIPIELLRYSNSYNSCFFYPSTKFINYKDNSNYTKTKFKAEKILKKIKKNNNLLNILRLPELNTKHNLSLIKRDLPNFNELILREKKIFNKVFFEK